MHRNSKRQVMDENAQASLFDAVMFFIVMMIASTLIFIFSNQAFQTQEVMSREDMMRYTDETREAILQSTVYETWYQDINGNIITRPPGSTNINDLLLEELALLDDGVPKEHFKDGFENNITNTMDKLVGTGYNYVLQASYTNESSQNTHEIYLSKAGSSGDIPDRDVTTSQWSSPMVHIGKPGNAAIKLSIWRA